MASHSHFAEFVAAVHDDVHAVDVDDANHNGQHHSRLKHN